MVEALQPEIQNPTLNETGYGVGLDQAAAYLAAKPDAQQLVVLSANGLGSFSYYFPGRTVPMNDFSVKDPQVAEILPDTDYVVVDFFNQKRKHIDQDLDDTQPEQSIWIQTELNSCASTRPPHSCKMSRGDRGDGQIPDAKNPGIGR